MTNQPAQREILFRGKRIEKDKWVFGCLVQVQGRAFIVPPSTKMVTIFGGEHIHWDDLIEVHPETIGMFTDITDKNGVKVYDGTKCTLFLPRDYQYAGREVQIVFVWKNNGWFMDGFGSIYGNYYFGEVKPSMLEITGNIHDKNEQEEAK